jgi:hypothetical protein
MTDVSSIQIPDPWSLLLIRFHLQTEERIRTHSVRHIVITVK